MRRTAPSAANCLLAALPRNEYRALRPALREVVLDAERVLYEPNKPIHHIYFIDEGLVSLVALMEDGSRVEAGLVGREGVVGVPVFLGARRSPFQAIVQVPGAARRLAVEDFAEAVARGKTLDVLLRRYLDAFLTHVAQSAVCNGHHSVEQRCCRWLLLAHDRLGRDEFPLTQKFMAAMLSVRRTGVAEVAGALQRAGLIRYTRGRITILDRKALEKASCPCFRIIKAGFDRIRNGR
jgi:CRP-like cAMP-binding protein